MKKKSSASDEQVKELLKKSGEIPKHIAIIMDGNGRWAKKRGLPRVAGHKRGVDTVKEIVEACAEIGVKFLTLYTFSTENWKRPKDEVSTLMRLLLNSLKMVIALEFLLFGYMPSGYKLNQIQKKRQGMIMIGLNPPHHTILAQM